MTLLTTLTARRLRKPAEKRRPNRRGDSGLTTLEWLLIVAAVAGLAALAVVLVQRVVGDTSEQIAGQSARKTAAAIAAQNITDLARAETAPASDADAAALNTDYKSDCKLLEITYGDVENLTVVWHTDITTTTPPTTDADANTMALWTANAATLGCLVS